MLSHILACAARFRVLSVPARAREWWHAPHHRYIHDLTPASDGRGARGDDAQGLSHPLGAHPRGVAPLSPRVARWNSKMILSTSS